MPRVSRLALVLLVLWLGVASAHAEDDREGPWAAAATAVEQAHARGDRAALARHAAAADPDPFVLAWLVVPRAPEAAAALAAAGDARLRVPLAALVGRLREAPPSAVQVAALRAAGAAFRRKDWQAVVAHEVAAPPEGDAAHTLFAAAVGLWRADALLALGRAPEGAQAFLDAGAQARRLGWHVAAQRGFRQGSLRGYRSLPAAAVLAGLQQLAEHEQALGRPGAAAEATYFEGGLLTELGQYTPAIARFQQARAAFQTQGRAEQAIRVEGGLATAYRLMGEYRRALALVESALERTGSARRRMELLLNLGAVQGALGAHDQAVVALDEALRLARGALGPDRVARYLGNVGMARLRAGTLDTARAALVEARALLEKHGDPSSLATGRTNLCYLALAAGDPQGAYDHGLAARAAVADQEVPFLKASIEQNLGESLLALGRSAEARTQFEGVAARTAELGARALVVESHRGLAEAHLALGDGAAALAAVQRGMAELGLLVGGLAQGQDAQARAQHARLFEVGAAAALALGDPAALAEVLESGRAMALLESLEGREALRAIALREDHRLAETKARAAVAEARALYHRALRRRNVALRRRKRTVLRAAEAQLEVVVGRIRRDARARAGLVFPQADDLPTLAGHLTQGEVLVLYGQTRTHYLALVVTEAGGRIVPLATREVIDAACEAAVAVTHASDVPHVKALAALETLLLKPLALGAKVQRVFVSPVGEIFRASLVSLDPKRIVAHVPSGTTLGLLRERRAARGKGVVAFGGVDYRTHARLSDLPASKEEAGEVGERSILGKDATEAGVRSVMASATRLRALHFACHGLFDQERPMWSALALTRAAPDDGMLTVSEIFGLQVQADLVTLSACESGRGRVYQAEGLLGLPRAFAYAGAPRVLCSLWKVDDDATRALMGKFYALWNPKTGAGMPAAQALREAQAYVRAQPQWKAPYYWAAWVVWGLP